MNMTCLWQMLQQFLMTSIIIAVIVMALVDPMPPPLALTITVFQETQLSWFEPLKSCSTGQHDDHEPMQVQRATVPSLVSVCFWHVARAKNVLKCGFWNCMIMMAFRTRLVARLVGT